MILSDKGEIVNDEEEDNGRDEMLPSEKVPSEVEEGVYKEVGSVSLVIMRALSAQGKRI